MKPVIIIAIVLVVVGGIIAFSNIDDLVSSSIEETTSQISSSIQESTSQVKFSNPLQTYEVDSKCELAYLIQDNLENNHGNSFKIDMDYVESLRPEWEEDAKKMNEEFGEAMRLDPEFMKQKNLELFELGRQKILDHIMEYNSIHPKLRDSVNLVSNFSTMDDPSQRMVMVDAMYLIYPESYQKDPECGIQFHERFGEETFKTFKTMYGEEVSQQKYAELKDVIYGN